MWMKPHTILGALLLCSLSLNGCSTVDVTRYDTKSGKDPKGIPFYLTKPMKKITTAKYQFIDLGTKKDLWQTEIKMLEIVNVVDTSQIFTINKTKAFAGETKFEFQRTVPSVAGVGDASSTDLSVVKTEDKEGITEFLKGLIEGSKSLVEAAKTAKEGGIFGAALAGTNEKEGELILSLLVGKNILVVKSVSVALEPI